MTYAPLMICILLLVAAVGLALRLSKDSGKLEQKIEQKEAETNATVKTANQIVNRPRTDADVISLLDKHIARAHSRNKSK